MSRIPSHAGAAGQPAERPAPKKTQGTQASAPPFPPARPRQGAAPASGAAHARQPPARNTRLAASPSAGAGQGKLGQSSTARQGARAGADADTAAAEAGPNPGTRFDGGSALLASQLFGDPAGSGTFADSGDDGLQEQALKETLLDTLRDTRQALEALDQGLDTAELARLLPSGGNDGIFDVILPTGERLGVVVSGQSSALSYLLSPSPDRFGSRLRRQRMELEQRMERLTHRNVNITVL
jgi:hypothetical protein